MNEMASLRMLCQFSVFFPQFHTFLTFIVIVIAKINRKESSYTKDMSKAKIEAGIHEKRIWIQAVIVFII